MKTILTAMVVALCAIGLMVSCTPDVNVAEEMLNNQGHILVKTVGNARSLKPGEHIYQLTNGIADKDVASKIMNTFNLDADQIVGLEFSDVSSIESSADSVFGALSNLAEVKADKNLQTIGANAFAGCANIGTIDLEGAKTISAGAFQGCSALVKVELPAAETIEADVFKGCELIAEVKLDNVKTVGEGAFQGCSSIKTLNLPKAEDIQKGAFQDCSALSEVSFGAVKTIGEDAFAGVDKLTEITFPATLKDIQKGAFKDANFDKVKFVGDTAPKVDISAFENTEDKDSALDFPGKDGGGNIQYYTNLTYNFYSMAFAQPSSETVTYNLLKGESVIEDQNKAVLEAAYGDYTFKGWSDKNDSVSLSGLVSMVDGTNYYAVYEKKVKVTFDKNSAVATGTENPVESTDVLMLIALGGNKTKTAVDKVSVTLPLTTSFTRTGYTFDGWKDASGKPYSAGSSVELSADTELKTQWKANPYVVSFAYKDFGGNEQAITAAQNSVNYDAYVSFPTAPTREGWTFVGWSKDNKSSNTVSTYTCDFTEAQKFYAVYKKAVNLNLYFVEAAYKNLSANLYNCNETASVDASSYASSYTWSTSNTAYVPFTGKLSSTTAIKEDTKLYQYKADLSVTVKYYTAAKRLKKTDTKTVKAVAKENTSGGFNILSGETIALLDLKTSLVTASDYNKVKGWKIGETSYAFGANYAPDSKTVDVYAEEEAKEYTITFYAYDKTTSFGSKKVKYTDDKDKTINSFSSKTTAFSWLNSEACSAYVFTGWKKEATTFPSETARDYADTDTIGTVLAANKTADTIELYATLATPVVNFLGTGGWIKTIKITDIKSIEFKNVKIPAGTTQTFYLDDANKAVPAVFNSSTGALTVYLGKAKIAPKDGFMKGTFQDMSNLKSVKGLKYFDLSEVTTIENIFNGCEKLESIEKFDLNGGLLGSTRAAFASAKALTFGPDFFSGWKTSQVTDMSNMFNSCWSATSIPVKDLDTSSCTSFANMFRSCSALTSIDLSSFNTANVKNLNSMFDGCRQLTTINVTKWNTSKVTDMNNMFMNCSSLTSLDLTSWSTASMVVNSSNGASNTGSMFYNCKALTAVYVSSKWTLKPATTTFDGCKISDYTKR